MLKTTAIATAMSFHTAFVGKGKCFRHLIQGETAAKARARTVRNPMHDQPEMRTPSAPGGAFRSNWLRSAL
ncbi:hypothetical protein CQZ93_00215 [Ochrobactrum vermis]|nr:hypothetical protein CQZ93_00215 [Ochrobactrum vermis]